MERALDRAVALLALLNGSKNLKLTLDEAASKLSCDIVLIEKLVENISSIDDVIYIEDSIVALKRNLDLLDSALLYKRSKGKGRSFVMDIIDSTNLEFVRNKNNAVHGDFIAAEIQTKGRGRYDHAWHTAIGSDLTLSGVFCFKKIKDTQGLSIVAAVTICRVLESYGVDVALKWPNDVYVYDRKLSGILIESVPRSSDIMAIIGIGLNVYRKHFKDERINAISLDEILPYTSSGLVDVNGSIVNRTVIASDLINKLKKYVARFEREGLSFFLKVYKKYDYLFARNISVKSGDFILQGRAEGLSSKGYLLLRDERGEIIEIKSGHIISID